MLKLLKYAKKYIVPALLSPILMVGEVILELMIPLVMADIVNLVQAEGGILQGIGMALTENITYDSTGHVLENSYMQYKIPTRLETGKIEVAFECSYEEEGPFGAKSIGEVVINTPLPSIADAIFNATGKRFTSLPITPERIIME